MFWFPSVREERYLNIVAVALVMMLVSLGFELLKLPTAASFGRPLVFQIIGLIALIFLNGILTWWIARDDYIRISYGLPRALATLGLFMIGGSIIFLARGFWDNTFSIGFDRQFSASATLSVLLGGQFIVMLFFATYFLKKTETSKVREFKRLWLGARNFVGEWLGGAITGQEEFKSAFKAVSPDLIALADAARALRMFVPKTEAAFAQRIADFAVEVHNYIRDQPTLVSIQQAGAFLETNRQPIIEFLGPSALRGKGVRLRS